MISYSLLDILQKRAGSGSFHMASERALRIEFMRFAKEQKLGPMKVEGDVVVTCLEGAFVIGEEGLAVSVLTQVVVAEGEVLTLVCTADQGAIRVIWAPPFPVAK